MEEKFNGWDFSFIADRWYQEETSWDYCRELKHRIAQINSLLDIGTGGGEFLSSLSPLPQMTYAIEGYSPNVPLAGRTLSPLGVKVIEADSMRCLPFAHGCFESVINRHAPFSPQEVYRILKPGGVFITQQIGGVNKRELIELLQSDCDPIVTRRSLEGKARRLEKAGFEIVEGHEEYPKTYFYDIGAVVFYLKATPWHVPDFSIDKYRGSLVSMHRTIQDRGSLVVTSHRFYVEALKTR
jgi:SAM-dependent methyltransferase